MKLITQKHPSGCGIACVAYALEISYDDALALFQNGLKRAKNEGFYCHDILKALDDNYCYFYVTGKKRHLIYKPNTIVYIKRSKKYPFGHYLVKADIGWMDPWVNFQQNKDIRDAKSGIRKRLPGTPIYAIYSAGE